MSTSKTYRIGWIVDSAPKRVFSFPWQSLGAVSLIRFGNVARYLDKNDSSFQMERYWPLRRYDAIVVIKKLNEPTLREVEKRQAKGSKIIFDSNVNYYEDWGEFDIPGTRPTPRQMELAKRMTEMADLVVADSTYLLGLIQKINPSSVMIPDAVDTDLYRPADSLNPSTPLRLIWCGISKKAHHLQMIENVLTHLKTDIRLHLVINRPHPLDKASSVIEHLQKSIGAQVSYYDYKRFVEDLQNSDVIVSPKILSSSYEMAHTEYKITTGMAVGLPALASPQKSYEEAVGSDEGGWICRSEEEWLNALRTLIANRDTLLNKSTAARRRVVERYSVPHVAELYKNALLRVLSSPESR